SRSAEHQGCDGRHPACAHVRGFGALAKIRLPHHSPEWRNGRRDGLKIRWGQPHESSTLSSGMTAPHRRVNANRAITHAITRTGVPGIHFKMEQRHGAFYQTGVDSSQSRARTERIDLVVGSGRRGQSYLYWRNGLLFELPVSYLAGLDRWINSPGYTDGTIDFARVIVPRCLECHSTSFKLQRERRALQYSREYELRISCEKCHGDGRRHVQTQC